MNDSNVSRRRLLGLCGTALAAGIAGCNVVTDGDGGSPGPDTSSPESPDGSSGDGAALDRLQDTATASGGTGTATADGADTTATPESVYTQVYRETVDSVVLVRTNSGQGTGWVYDDGHVVTNAHVVGSAGEADVRFNVGDWSAGEVVGSDPQSDLAVIAVDERPDAATPLSMTDGGATVGQEVVAIGNPFNLDGTVTTGIVSGTDRWIPSPAGYRIPDAIQTDAAVNPGNSGGPLMDLSGNVLAVINSGGGDNIAFGISAALTRRVVPELIEHGEYDHPYLGASFTTVTPAIAEANGLDEPRGLLVTGVGEDGPAGGVLQPSQDTTVVDGRRVRTGGDVVLAVDGTEIETVEDLGSYLALQTRPGDTVELRILRDGSERTVSVELGVRPSRPISGA